MVDVPEERLRKKSSSYDSFEDGVCVVVQLY